MFGVLLMQRECISVLSGVAVSVGHGVVVMPKAGAEVYCKRYAYFFLLNSRFYVLRCISCCGLEI